MARYLDSGGVTVLWGEFLKHLNNEHPKYDNLVSWLSTTADESGVKANVVLEAEITTQGNKGPEKHTVVFNANKNRPAVDLPLATKNQYGVIRLASEIAVNGSGGDNGVGSFADDNFAVTPGVVRNFVERYLSGLDVFGRGITEAFYQAISDVTNTTPTPSHRDDDAHIADFPVYSSDITPTQIGATTAGIPVDAKTANSIARTSIITDANDKILSYVDDGKIKSINSSLSLYYDSKASKIYLLGRPSSNVTDSVMPDDISGVRYVIVSEISTVDFVRDGFLDSVTIDKSDAEGNAGTYLHFVWNTDSLYYKKQHTYVDLEELLDNVNYKLVLDKSFKGVIGTESDDDGVDRRLVIRIGLANLYSDYANYLNSPVDENNRFVTLAGLASIFEAFHFDISKLPVHGLDIVDGSHKYRVPNSADDVIQLPTSSTLKSVNNSSADVLATEKALATGLDRTIFNIEKGENGGVEINVDNTNGDKVGPHRIVKVWHKNRPASTDIDVDLADVSSGVGQTFVTGIRVDKFGHIARVSTNPVNIQEIREGQGIFVESTGFARIINHQDRPLTGEESDDGIYTGGTSANSNMFVNRIEYDALGHIAKIYRGTIGLGFYEGDRLIHTPVIENGLIKLPVCTSIPSTGALDSILPSQKAVLDLFNSLFNNAANSGIYAGNTGIVIDKNASDRTVKVSHRAKPVKDASDCTNHPSGKVTSYATKRTAGTNLGTAVDNDTGSNVNGWISVVTEVQTDTYGHVSSIDRQYASADVPLSSSEITEAFQLAINA